MDCEQHKKERTMVEARLMEENRRLQEKVDASVNRLGSLEKEVSNVYYMCMYNVHLPMVFTSVVTVAGQLFDERSILS